MIPLVYLNGNFIPRDQAKIDVLDRGFIFADGVYEVIPVYQQIPFHIEDHLLRLKNSCKGIALKVKITNTGWKKIFTTLLKPFPTANYAIYLQVTRGAAAVREHIFPAADVKPTVYVQVSPLASLSAAQLKQGLSAITTEDLRWKWCHIKSIALLPNVLAREQAKNANAHEAILLRDGQLTEGCISNVFVIKNGKIQTPPLDGRILPGITRKIILALAAKHNILSEEIYLSYSDLLNADEIWISNSTKEVAPVTCLDGKPVGKGKVGAVWKQMFNYFQQHKANYNLTSGNNNAAFS